MKNRPALALMAIWGVALPGYHYEFPRDHYNHPEYQTEWWYYTGNLHTAEGRKFGFELTFFRQGVDRSAQKTDVWDVRDVWMAHLALSDIDGGRFFHTERLNRAGAGVAGADQAQEAIWNGNWRAHIGDGTAQQLRAVADNFSVELSLKSVKPPVIHGVNGVSQKAQGAGRASHYISLTRLITHGMLTLDGKQYAVDGLSWMDHEFFTHQLEPDQVGWDWFSLQFDDGTELMLFRIRRQDGAIDSYSAGTYVDAKGRATHLSVRDFSLAPGRTWKRYPIAWDIAVPSLDLKLALSTRLPQQELTGAVTYWEGAIECNGTKRGAGYLEMTGYTAPVPLSAALTRSGVNGIWRNRAPVASKTAFPIAAAMTVIDVSPAPVASSSGRFTSTHSTLGSAKPSGRV
ncbi:MAG TPA: lipocalin-like domain-containing protein [Bryobacteraceae bacterium]|nr:lipocalin-like domain-containing protein [Bryobacteraceae bacterium]